MGVSTGLNAGVPWHYRKKKGLRPWRLSDGFRRRGRNGHSVAGSSAALSTRLLNSYFETLLEPRKRAANREVAGPVRAARRRGPDTHLQDPRSPTPFGVGPRGKVPGRPTPTFQASRQPCPVHSARSSLRSDVLDGAVGVRSARPWCTLRTPGQDGQGLGRGEKPGSGSDWKDARAPARP